MSTRPGLIASMFAGILLLALAVSVDFPSTSGGGFKGDESTYYVLAHSLARDFDFQYERKDLIRVWEEYPGPQGIFLKRGKDVSIGVSGTLPFVHWVKNEDPLRDTRLYFSKSYIYPLAAAPFVFVFGTNGFLVFHALLLALDLLVIYLFVMAVTQSNWTAVPLAIAFLGVSVVPVYFVWLTPELFNFSLVLYAVFLWAYKEVAREHLETTGSGFLASRWSDYLAAVVIAVATFSKPSHLLVLAPLVLLAALRREWKHAAAMTAICALVTAGFFALNVAITGEFNYQGGDRKTFYHHTGFPFANSWETFDTIGPVFGREDLMVGDVLANQHSLTVFRHNLWYFIAGRNAGLIPYFFPGLVCLTLFLISKRKQPIQWIALATIVGAVIVHLFVWPFTWNGGGGPVGSRYFMPFYPLFLVLLPATAGFGAAVTAFVVGACFTAPVVLNPFFSSLRTGEHTKSGVIRWLPLELTLIHDLPVAQNPDRMKRPLGGDPPLLAYFPDDNSYNPEKDWFWVKGRSKAEIVLRGAVADAGNGTWISKAVRRLSVEIRNGGAQNRVTISTGNASETFTMDAGDLRTVSLPVSDGVPFRREVQPTSYLYLMSVETTAGFVPFLEVPCPAPRKCPSSDSRFLGAMIRVVPEYTDADVTKWKPSPGGGIGAGKDETRGILDPP